MARARAGALRSKTDKFFDSWEVTLIAGVSLPIRRRATPGSSLRWTSQLLPPSPARPYRQAAMSVPSRLAPDPRHHRP